MVISPFVKAGTILPGAGSADPVPFDHTSILKLIIEKFGLSGNTPEIRRIEARPVRSSGELLNNFDTPIAQAPQLPVSLDSLTSSLPNASTWHVTPNAKAFQGAIQKVWQAFPEHVEQSIPHAVEAVASD